MNPLGPAPKRPPAQPPQPEPLVIDSARDMRRVAVERLAAAREEVGAQREMQRLKLLGEVHCLAPDISEAEFLGVLARGGLCVSSIDGVQLIHRMPPSAA